jgi:hypothetical protein
MKNTDFIYKLSVIYVRGVYTFILLLTLFKVITIWVLNNFNNVLKR